MKHIETTWKIGFFITSIRQFLPPCIPSVYRALSLFCLMICMTGCQTLMFSDAWENTKTAFRYLQQSGKALVNADNESRLVSSRQAFYGESEVDFIPLNASDLQSSYVDYAVPQAKEVPGEIGGAIPGIEAFKTPSKALASIFSTIYFNTDQHVPKSKESFNSLNRIATYLKKHPTSYIFIAGHCDERASEAYNLSLGTRRSNYVRNYLIKQGVHPDQLFTISYGKERPISSGHSENSWAKNRRTEFKIYEKRTTL